MLFSSSILKTLAGKRETKAPTRFANPLRVSPRVLDSLRHSEEPLAIISVSALSKKGWIVYRIAKSSCLGAFHFELTNSNEYAHGIMRRNNNAKQEIKEKQATMIRDAYRYCSTLGYSTRALL